MELDAKHNQAVREEIGETLRTLLSRESPSVPPRLRRILRRFQELDHEASPSIVPDMPRIVPDMPRERTARPDVGPFSAWLRKWRAFK